MSDVYPNSASERNPWILARRTERKELDPEKPYAFLVERERTAGGEVVDTATIFLTNSECPWRCVMCDLWKNTLPYRTPRGAIPAQLEFALGQLSAARQVKLYNSGSFFDARAVPVEDHAAIARAIRPFEFVVVENHPALTDERCLGFRDLLDAELEIAMGLETAHPETLEKLNKQMTLELFEKAAGFLRSERIGLRVFVLLQPPFLPGEKALEWAMKSIDFAFDCGAAVVSLIPTRLGNGALEALARAGQFAEPRFELIEAALEYGIGTGRGRVFADLWDLKRFLPCPSCFGARQQRLHQMNLQQTILPKIRCLECEN